MTHHILVVEDNRDLAEVLRVNLQEISCTVDLIHNGADGLQQALHNSYDLIILDLMLPGLDGTEICRRIRKQNSYTPIVMLTSRSSELDRVVGLELGADDYITKPFSLKEFLARIKAIFRRMEAMQGEHSHSPEIIRAGSLVLDTGRRSVHRDGRRIELTAKEFDLLLHFASHPGRVYNRSQLLEAVWGYGHDGYEHTVNSHINRLRAKIEKDSSSPECILTVWGVGYKFNESPGEAG